VSVPLFDHLDAIASRLNASSHWLLGSDYDGTLTPLVGHPSRAKLSPAMRDLLHALARRATVSMAIVSGRALTDLQSMVAIERLIYAGNHGLEIHGPGLRYVDLVAVEKREATSNLAQILARKLQRIAGVFVENKGLTLTVHYRLAAPYLIPEVHRIVERVFVNDTRGFLMTHGKMALELRPTPHWNKGNAIDWIRTRPHLPNPLTLFLGDDQTDEDAFHALHDGITIRVGGDVESTKAQYHVESPTSVSTFLHWLNQVAGRR
jgi:trehalose 6-phosphate phosphatase